MAAHEPAFEEMLADATRHLVSLIRIDTTNPPGNEIAAARYLSAVLDHEGIPFQVFEPSPGRGSLVARLPGAGARKPLLLMGHLDVVPARPDGWRFPPFSGAVSEGAVWGRGSLDCKDMVAAWLTIIVWLKRLGLPLERDVILAATADEECGGAWGMGWLAEHHRSLLDAEAALNEGGGMSFEVGGARGVGGGGGSGAAAAGAGGAGDKGATVFTCQTAEKGVCWLRLTAAGPAGHGSIPLADNATVRLATAVSSLGTRDLPVHLTPVVEGTFEALLAAAGLPASDTLRKVVAGGGRREDLESLLPKRLAEYMYAALRNTAAPTVMRAGDKTNVIPAHAVAEVDGRLLEGFTPQSLIEELREGLGAAGEGVRFEVTLASQPSESSPESPVMECLRRSLAAHAGRGVMVPYLCAGMTDGRFLRAMGVPVYGFWPELPHVPIETTHGTDEHVPLDSFRFALAVMWDAVVRFCCRDDVRPEG